MYKLTFFVVAFVMLTSCGDKKNKPEEDFTPTTSSDEGMAAPEGSAADATTYDPNRGIGKHTSVDLGDKLDVAMAAEGEKIQSVKCSSCHKLTDEKLVGPGWIMNFITNPDPMIDKDPKLQAQLELCLVRMPNQALTDTDARNLLEYMRKNDGVK